MLFYFAPLVNFTKPNLPLLPRHYRGAEVIQHQIEEREQQRLLDSERKDQETQALLQYLEQLQEEDMESYFRKREAQQALMEEVAKCNEVRAAWIRWA